MAKINFDQISTNNDNNNSSFSVGFFNLKNDGVKNLTGSIPKQDA